MQTKLTNILASSELLFNSVVFTAKGSSLRGEDMISSKIFWLVLNTGRGAVGPHQCGIQAPQWAEGTDAKSTTWMPVKC